jgi:hypothetical protein
MFNFPNTDIQGFAVPPNVAPYTIRTPLHFSLFLEQFISYSADEEKTSCSYETPTSVTLFTEGRNQMDRITSRLIRTDRFLCPKVICSYEDSQCSRVLSIYMFLSLRIANLLICTLSHSFVIRYIQFRDLNILHAKHLARMGDMRYAYKITVGKNWKEKISMRLRLKRVLNRMWGVALDSSGSG